MRLLSHYVENQRKIYPEIVNWENYIINDMLFYSYRDTEYDELTYPSTLHYHDYFELIIFEGGDVKYICESSIYQPGCADVILIPPGKFHMSAINGKKTRYKRHVFYLYPSAFEAMGQGCLAEFLTESKNGDILSFSSLEMKKELLSAAEGLKKTLSHSPSPLDRALGLSYIIRIFYLLNNESCQPKKETLSFPEKVIELQRYIDDNFTSISSVSQVAEHFFYSREYVSRLFRKHFDTTISDYILKRRIAKSQALIMQGVSIIDAAYTVGFGSLSTFIRAFRSVTDMTPSEYRKLWRESAITPSSHTKEQRPLTAAKQRNTK